MSLQGLQERLAALQETTTRLRELIERLATVDFQPGALPQEDTDDESSVTEKLSAEISQLLRGQLDEQELLAEELKFVGPEGPTKATLREGVERAGVELSGCRVQFRKARLTARQKLVQAQDIKRQLLIQSYTAPVSEPDAQEQGVEHTAAPVFRPQRHVSQNAQQSILSEQDQQTVGASSNVTKALRRTHDLIAAELYRSEYAHQTLTESSAALRQLNESYTSLDSMLASSRDLLGTLLRSQKSDTWYLQTALYMLMGTGAWLLFRRILYGPLWWLVWLPLRIMFGIGSKAGSAVMQRPAPGESGKPGTVANEPAPVDGLPGDELPTAQAGSKKLADDDGQESMVESVAKIVDAAREADEVSSVSEDEETSAEGQPRNPKKRMWEEPEVVEESQHRDEL